MAMPWEAHHQVIVESYYAVKSGKSTRVHVRPVAGQGYDTKMDVRCRRDMRDVHPIGTKFLIWAKLTDKEGGKPFLSTFHGGPYEVIE